MAFSESWGLFAEYIEANTDGNAVPHTVQDIETIMTKIIDARVEQKLAEYGLKPHADAPDSGKA